MSDPWATILGPGAQPAPTSPTPVTPAAPAGSAAQPAPQSADPWHSVLGPGASTSTTTDAAGSNSIPASSYDSTWKPSGNAFVDFMMMPRAKTEDIIPAAKDYSRAIFDWGTQGFGNDIQAAISGNTT